MIHTDPLHISMELISDKVRFTGALRDLSPLTVDYTEPIGDGQGYTSLELLLASLATCVASTVLLVVRRMHRTVTACTVSADGVRRTEHPTGFATITLHLRMASPDLQETELQSALRIAEETLCPVWAMLKGNVEITVHSNIVTPQEITEQSGG